MVLASTRLPRRGLRSRQQEIRQCLAACGLVRGSYRRWLGESVPVAEPAHARRLVEALTRLGPVFETFGLYLASRPDWLPACHCRRLAKLTPDIPATPAAAVYEQMARELGRSPQRVYSDLEAAPCEIGLLFQAHRARLEDGQPVTVKVAHPGGEDRIAADLASLHLLEAVFAGPAWSDFPLESAIADFHHTIHQQTDFVHESTALDAVVQDAREFELLRVPAVHRELSTARLLTLERLPGERLADLIVGHERDAARAERARRAQELRDLASRLCTAWLRQALLSRFFPVDVGVQQVLVLPNGQLAFTGVHGSLPTDSQKNLWNYLLAVATNDPDNACGCLFKEMEKDPRSVQESDLRQRFRQVVPFRDCEREATGERNDLASYLWVHARLARAHGCRPPLPLARFYRGLFLVHEAAQRLAPGRDALRDGLENVRVLAAFAQFRDLLSLEYVNQNLEKLAPILHELPRKLDEVLTLAAQGSARMYLHVRESAERRKQKNATATLMALLLMLAGAALLIHHFAPADEGGSWPSKAGFAACLMAGMWFLGRLGGNR